MNNYSAYASQMKFSKSFIYNIHMNLSNGDACKNKSNLNLDIDDLIFFDEEWYLRER